MDNMERKQWKPLYQKAEELGGTIYKVAQMLNAKEEDNLKEGEKALVLELNASGLEISFVEKCEGNFIRWTDTKQVDLKEESEKADKRLLEKMKEVIDFEMLNSLGIRETDEKNKKAFEKFYKSLEQVKKQFLKEEEVALVFTNIWLKITDTMTRKEYQQCMIPLYQFVAKKVQEIQDAYLINEFSKIYLTGDKREDVSLREYLEEQYGTKVCSFHVESL